MFAECHLLQGVASSFSWLQSTKACPDADSTAKCHDIGDLVLLLLSCSFLSSGPVCFVLPWCGVFGSACADVRAHAIAQGTDCDTHIYHHYAAEGTSSVSILFDATTACVPHTQSDVHVAGCVAHVSWSFNRKGERNRS